MKFETYTLGSLCHRVTSGGTPKSTVPEYYNGSIPWLNTKEISFNRIVATERTISQLGLENSSAKWINVPAVIVAMYGATAGKIAVAMRPLTTNQACCNMEIREDKADFRYVYYYLKWKYPDLSSLANGGAQQNLNAQVIKEFPIQIPPIDVQKMISDILWKIDDKIELNQRINENLERQAEAVFKSWFVDFEPFSGMQPQSWETVTLGTITALISRGITPKYVEESNQIVLNQKCIRNHVIDLSLSRKHRPKAVNEKWIQFGDLLINSTGAGTLGRTAQVWFVPQNMTVDSHITIVRPKDELLIHYIGLWGIMHEKEIESLHTGSTGQTELPRERVKSLELLLPDDETLCKFRWIIQPIVTSIVARQEENQQLAELRDALLPKLMSGEIDVTYLSLSQNKEKTNV